jgi:predicted RNA-binding Zn-ribbon protein involved in translation (DUF1610 family)
MKGLAMTDTNEEMTCPNCGSHEVFWVHTTYMGHEVSYMMCEDCDEQFGGDL